jgi:uncharacterized membrane protein YgcG
MRLATFLIIFLILLFFPSANAIEYPSPVDYVNDFAEILDSDQEMRLNNEITAIEKDSTVEIAIVTIESLQGVSIEEYAVKLFEKWGIGKKGVDNGLLILVAKKERQYRIEVGYGLEGVITDAQSSKIGRDILMPRFKNNEFGEGLYEAVQEIRIIVAYPSQIGSVNDFAEILDSDEEARINNAIRAIENNSLVEIVIVTSKSFQSASIKEYSTNLFKKWGIGKRSNYHGILIFVVTDDRDYYQYIILPNKAIITDEQARKVGKSLEQNFNNGEFGRGFQEAVFEIGNVVEENPDIFTRIEGEMIKYEITVNNIPRIYYFSKDARNSVLLLSIFILIPFGILTAKKKRKQARAFILGYSAILLIAAYIYSIGIYWYILPKLLFLVLILLFLEGIISGRGKGGYGSGWGSRSGSRSSGFSFGGGRSGGGGSSGNW